MRILGIDLGSSSIKAVEMDSAFGRYDIHDYHEYPIAPGSTPEEALALLLKNLPKPPDRIVVGLKGSLVTFRNLELPTRDKKAIQSTINFELEDELPFPTEDLVSSHTLLSQNRQGSRVHVAATLKQRVASFLDLWQKYHIDPDIVTTEVWAYRTLINRVLTEKIRERPILLMQIGHIRTTLYLHFLNRPLLIRDIPWGGQNLTENFEECLQRLLKEIKQADLSCKSVSLKNISGIYLSGGTSLAPGLAAWIEEKTKFPTKTLLALSSATSSGVTYSEQTDAKFVLAASLTLTLVGADRAQPINFRKNEFAKQSKSREFRINTFKKPLIALGTVLACLFLSLSIQSSVYKNRLISTDKQLDKSIRSFFSDISNSAVKSYMASTRTLRTAVDKELNKEREISRLFAPNPQSPLHFLNDLSIAIPKDIIIDLVQFQVGTNPSTSFFKSNENPTANLTFLVSNPQIIERLSTVLGEKISNIQRSKAEEVPATDGAGSKWKITFSGSIIGDGGSTL